MRRLIGSITNGLLLCCLDRSSLLSLTWPRGRTAHSFTARGVDCAGVLPRTRFLFRHSPGRGVGPPTVSRHEVSTAQVCCLRPSSHPSLTGRRGVGRPQCHGTRCRLCRCAASGPSSVLSLTGQRGWPPTSFKTASAQRLAFFSLVSLPARQVSKSRRLGS